MSDLSRASVAQRKLLGGAPAGLRRASRPARQAVAIPPPRPRRQGSAADTHGPLAVRKSDLTCEGDTPPGIFTRRSEEESFYLACSDLYFFFPFLSAFCSQKGISFFVLAKKLASKAHECPFVWFPLLHLHPLEIPRKMMQRDFV